MEDDSAYYNKPTDKLHALQAFREMGAIHGMRNQPAAEQAFVMEAFCTDVVESLWPAYSLDRAVIAWRRSGERFVPTFGQLNACVKDAGQAGGKTQYQDMHKSIMSFVPAPRPIEGKVEPEQKKTGADGMDRQELQAFILKLEKGKIAKEYPTASGKIIRFTKYDDKMLAGLKSRLARLQVTA